MKKTFSFLAAFLMAALSAQADLAPTVMLHHAGHATMFTYDKIQDAVNAAVNGDTIYLSEGTFSPFNVNKRIMVRGTGYSTIIDGDCQITISGTSPLTMPVLDAMCFNGNINVTSGYKQFTLRKCRAKNISFTNSDFYDVKFDRCFVSETFHLTTNVKEFTAFNTKIYMLHPHDYTEGIARFEHCNIYYVCDTISRATFNCSWVYETKKMSGAKTQINLIGCVFNYCATLANVQNNWSSECEFNYCFTAGNSGGVNWNPSSDYICSDGTKCGAYGGQHPFTQWPEVPAVTKHILKVDVPNKKLNVTLTIDKLVKYE